MRDREIICVFSMSCLVMKLCLLHPSSSVLHLQHAAALQSCMSPWAPLIPSGELCIRNPCVLEDEAKLRLHWTASVPRDPQKCAVLGVIAKLVGRIDIFY